MKDRLSDLPDCVLLRILSSLHTKQAVQTCVLSTRYNNLWKHVPVLSLGPCLFKTRKGFTKFVSRFLSLHDESTALRRLSLDRDGSVSFLGGADPFSGFPMLKSLRISCSKILGEQNLCISSITLILSWSQLRSIKHVEIYAYMLQNFAQIPSNLLGWLLELTDIKSLKISSDTLQVYLNTVCKERLGGHIEARGIHGA
ncbi:F-box/FBD/LRR-repeat protein At1g51370 [Medicago truncatula]|uniref:F-box/FBD/LRR-repeat protein At1g51370 n=1 Tax=Medicago truncatula TaxID=3880 RepID=UPI000D2F3F9D|nr:F-box/FBD/LRR-repeat protein At1g51370-like [Medicago truncatula]